MRPQPEKPGPGQESVWDYTRPPRLETTPARLTVICGGRKVAETTQGLRILETSHPPTYYIPLSDVATDYLYPSQGESWCEWKGRARYYDIRMNGETWLQACWYYPKPNNEYSALANHVCFYACRVDECRVDGEIVIPQPGEFYGGWITGNIVGPFKGIPGSQGW